MRIKELERLYGIVNGGDRKSERQNVGLKSQEDIASLMGMDTRTLQRHKQLSDMVPELDELVTTGTVSKMTALAIMKNLTEEEQQELIEGLDTTQKYTQKEIQEFINKTEQAEDKADRLEREKIKLQNENYDLRNIKPEVVERVVEKVPEDYERLNSTILSAGKSCSEQYSDPQSRTKLW